MKILVLTNRVPYPLHDGGNLAVNALLRGLKQSGIYIHLLSMNTSRHEVSDEDINTHFSFLDKVETVPVNNNIDILGALSALIKRQSYHISRFISNEFRSKLVRLLKQEDWDIIHLEGLFVTPYLDIIQQHSQAPIVYRQHNIEFKIWKEQAEHTHSFLKRRYLKILAKQLEQYEIEVLKKIRYILPISPLELQENIKLGAFAEQIWIPYGLDDHDFERMELKQEFARKVYHIGAMDWMPNAEGLQWFIENVWPIVREEIKDAEFHYAGRNMTEKLEALANSTAGVFCHGSVADAKLFEVDKDILVVPLKSAAGIRIKTIKAMAHGKVVVSTRKGAAGLDVIDAKHLLLADTASEMAEKIILLMRNKFLYQELSHAGFQLAKHHYYTPRIIQKLISFYQAIRKEPKEEEPIAKS